MRFDLTFFLTDADFMRAVDYILEDTDPEDITPYDALYAVIAILLKDDHDGYAKITIDTFIKTIPEDTQKELIRQFYNHYMERMHYNMAKQLGLNP